MDLAAKTMSELPFDEWCGLTPRIQYDVLRKLRAEIADHNDFMAMLAGELARMPCVCDDGGHENTPPMMWPELIRCIAARAFNDGQKEKVSTEQHTGS